MATGWKGEESVKERVVLDEPQVVPFLTGSYTLERATEALRKKVPLLLSKRMVATGGRN